MAWTMKQAQRLLEGTIGEQILKVGAEEFPRAKRVSRDQLQAEAAALGLEIEYEIYEDVFLIWRPPPGTTHHTETKDG